MYDVAVIGGGFWGTAVAFEARRQGATVLHVDDVRADGASRSAAGIVCRGWYRQQTVRGMLPGDWTQHDVDVGFAWLQRHAGLRQTGEVFWSYQRGERRLRDDCYLIPSCDSVLGLATPEVREVTRLQAAAGRWRLLQADGGDAVARHVVVAAGAHTDRLLAVSGLPVVGVRPLRGRALILKLPERVDVPHTYMARPYTHYTLRPWGTGSRGRLGDTVERTPGRTMQDTGLLETARMMAPGYAVERALDGVRPVCDQFTVREVATGVIVATGGHRVGLGLAGAVAGRTLALCGIAEGVTP